MKIQWRKALLIMAAYYLVVVLQGCCSCPGLDKPYFDYKSLQIESFGSLADEPEEGMILVIRPDETEFIASEGLPLKQWSLVNTAYACDCPGDGSSGAKYAVTAINIYAEDVFDASIPAEMPLNALFEVSPTGVLSTKPNYLSLEAVNNSGDVMYPYLDYPGHEFFLRTKALPVALGKPYYFTVEVIRANGTTVRASSQAVVWAQ